MASVSAKEALLTGSLATMQTAENHLSARALRKRSRKTVSAKKTARRAPAIPAILDQPEIEDRHKAILAEVMSTMPDDCIAKLRTLVVRYDNPESRGLAGKSTVILSGNVPDMEFRALAEHEFGHFQELGCLVGDPHDRRTAFYDGPETFTESDPSVEFYKISWVNPTTRRDDAEDEDFASMYAASTDCFEDLAEFRVAYVMHDEGLRELAKTNFAIAQKVAWMDRYMPRSEGVAQSDFRWTGTPPWDTTKLPYVWNGATNAVTMK